MRTLLLTTNHAHRLTGVPVRTLQRWLADGRLPNHGTPRTARVEYTELVAYLHAQGRTAEHAHQAAA
jgi:excisionase family DNA binding protein